MEVRKNRRKLHIEKEIETEKINMKLFKKYIIKSSVEIKTTPEVVWDFFYKIEANYKNWHPKDHNYFRWTKGKPLEVGSEIDSEEIMDGHKVKIKGTCIESVKNVQQIIGIGIVRRSRSRLSYCKRDVRVQGVRFSV